MAKGLWPISMTDTENRESGWKGDEGEMLDYMKSNSKTYKVSSMPNIALRA